MHQYYLPIGRISFTFILLHQCASTFYLLLPTKRLFYLDRIAPSQESSSGGRSKGSHNCLNWVKYAKHLPNKRQGKNTGYSFDIFSDILSDIFYTMDTLTHFQLLIITMLIKQVSRKVLTYIFMKIFASILRSSPQAGRNMGYLYDIASYHHGKDLTCVVEPRLGWFVRKCIRLPCISSNVNFTAKRNTCLTQTSCFSYVYLSNTFDQ